MSESEVKSTGAEVTTTSTEQTAKATAAPAKKPLSYTKLLRRISDSELRHEIRKREKAGDAFAIALGVVFDSPLSQAAIRQSARERKQRRGKFDAR